MRERPAVNLGASAICLAVTASARLRLELTMARAASFFCAPDLAP
jgi:hypothetical protein